ncbi:hypothetical protein I4F81_001888 [Pyropia yezoensis]|uniref:Uncharacterized protein n=1 Tax=Pyropia yezoensis TaxID=2788 RepID=A0ACC3BMU6_PYRYE|nr:hypothetical protein I4F81_001888 [Neopyropia yezoensis]
MTLLGACRAPPLPTPILFVWSPPLSLSRPVPQPLARPGLVHPRRAGLVAAATPPPSRRQAAAHVERRAVGPPPAAATARARPPTGGPEASVTPGRVSDVDVTPPLPEAATRTAEALPLRGGGGGASLSDETRRKISRSMVGQAKTAEMREKLSTAMRGRTPWNKGKKMSPETRARMSEARTGSSPWNKGRRLSRAHRLALSRSLAAAMAAGKRTGPSTDRLPALTAAARARPRADGIVRGGARVSIADGRGRPGVAGGGGGGSGVGGVGAGEFPLVATADIHEFVSLRRELRVWSDAYAERNDRRPSLADVRRLAPVPVVRKFEVYMRMRQLLRGLAADVVGGGAAAAAEAAGAADGQTQFVRRPDGTLEAVDGGALGDNLQQQGAAATPIGAAADGIGVVGGATAARSAFGGIPAEPLVGDDSSVGDGDEGAHDDMGVGLGRSDYSSGFLSTTPSSPSLSTLGDAAATPSRSPPSGQAPRRRLSADDYRLIGKHRLMTTGDIHSYIQLRRQLKAWSDSWKATHHASRPPSLSDVREDAPPSVYAQFCEYLSLRARMRGLAKEVFGAEVDDVEGMQRTANAGESILHALKAGARLSGGAGRGVRPPSRGGGSSSGFTGGAAGVDSGAPVARH